MRSGSHIAMAKLDDTLNQSYEPCQGTGESECTQQIDSTSPESTPLMLYDEQNVQETEVVTTLMLKNIPSRFDQAGLMSALEVFGLSTVTHYDFFYMPCNPRTNKNLGYAFINFLSHCLLEEFTARLANAKLLDTSHKLLEVTPARVQGYSANLRLFEEAQAMESAETCPLKTRPIVMCRVSGLLIPVSPKIQPVPMQEQEPDESSRAPVNPFFRMNTAWSFLAEY